MKSMTSKTDAERKRLIYCVAKRDRRRRFSDAVWALDGKDREENNPPEGHTSGAPPANIEMHEADLYLERKMQERQMKDESQNPGSVRYADGEYAAERRGFQQ